jgi:hypothetical protein
MMALLTSFLLKLSSLFLPTAFIYPLNLPLHTLPLLQHNLLIAYYNNDDDNDDDGDFIHSDIQSKTLLRDTIIRT